MGQETERDGQVVEMVSGFIPVTSEGKERARRKLNAAREAVDPQRRAELRARLGLAPRPA
jgi:hypothetical protein